MGRVQLLLLNFTIISTLDASLGIILFTRRLTLDKPTFCKRDESTYPSPFEQKTTVSF